MLSTRGYAAKTATSNFEPYRFDRRDPGPDDVLIEIDYCGICHSDIHQIRDEWGGSIYPMVPGHEIIGRVTGVGANVKRFRVGDLAGVGCYVDSCRTCDSCTHGYEHLCQTSLVLTYNGLERDRKTPTYGGYSNQIVVDEKYTLHIPETIPLTNRFDFLLDCVSAPHDLNVYLNMLDRDGALVIVGIPAEPAEIAAFSLIRNRRRLAGSMIGGMAETQQMLDYCGDKKISSDVEVIGIEDAQAAYERVIKGDVRYRFVIDLKTL